MQNWMRPSVMKEWQTVRSRLSAYRRACLALFRPLAAVQYTRDLGVSVVEADALHKDRRRESRSFAGAVPAPARPFTFTDQNAVRRRATANT
ncbi:hypothetical protein [Rhodobacter lacus]|uniref:Uncharacterized protein n=1 Tax=Rhodobacter lacus TaxID=1641972 RepID=A0ABW5A801_9RHOB